MRALTAGHLCQFRPNSRCITGASGFYRAFGTTGATSGVVQLDYYTAWFCPFAHRATLALEHHAPAGVAYVFPSHFCAVFHSETLTRVVPCLQLAAAQRRVAGRNRYNWIEALGWSKKDEEEVDANSGETLSHSWWYRLR